MTEDGSIFSSDFPAAMTVVVITYARDGRGVEGAARLPDDGVVHQLAGRRGPLRILTVKRDPKCSLPVKRIRTVIGGDLREVRPVRAALRH
jgi:hypothetical protein